jgi:hypothetical protein
MAELQACLLRSWVHSHEEDTQEVRVYRPAEYAFPPSRGRTGFEFRAGGELIYRGIGRTDRSEPSPGRWVIEAPNRVRVELDHDRSAAFVVEVVSCDDAALKVRR